MLITFLFSLSDVSAHFVCGIVNDSEDGMSSHWFGLQLSFTGTPEKFTTCDVSPKENKYCCDPDDIPPKKKWKIGKSVSAEVFDTNLGYIAGPVSTITTGEGYDILPEMKLKKVINVFSPSTRLILSNNTNITLNASFESPFNNVQIEKNLTKKTLCTNCSNINLNETANQGMNYWKLFASDNKENFQENLSFALLSKANLSRTLNCNGCSKNKIKASTKFNMSLSLSLSSNVENLELKEYIPINWNITNQGNGQIKDYSQTHKIISWNVSNKDSSFSYTATSPDIFIRQQNHYFKTELEEELINEGEITVYKIISIPFFGKKAEYSSRSLENISRKKISPAKPLVIETEEIVVAIYPKKNKNDAKMELKKANFDIRKSSIMAYFFNTNLDRKEIEQVFVKFRIDKKEFKSKKYSGKEFFVLEDMWEKSKIEKYDEDKEYYYYRSFFGPIRGIAFTGIEEKLTKKIDIKDLLTPLFLNSLKGHNIKKMSKKELITRYIFFYYF